MQEPQYKYANIPQFQYQSFERELKTYEIGSLTFSSYPITPKNTNANRLTEGKDQDNQTAADAEPKKEDAPVEPPTEEPSKPAEESSSNSEPAGKY
jgi:hypothetical protein